MNSIIFFYKNVIVFLTLKYSILQTVIQILYVRGDEDIRDNRRTRRPLYNINNVRVYIYVQ